MSYTAQRKNRVIQIAEEKADEYAKMGYQVKDSDGEIIKEPVDTSIEGAKETIAKLKAESSEKDQIIKELNKKIDELDETIAKLRAGDAEENIPAPAKAAAKTTTKKA